MEFEVSAVTSSTFEEFLQRDLSQSCPPSASRGQDKSHLVVYKK
jgi:hypothetical protein